MIVARLGVTAAGMEKCECIHDIFVVNLRSLLVVTTQRKNEIPRFVV